MLDHLSIATARPQSFLPRGAFTELEENFFASEARVDETDDYYRAPLLSRLATQIADFLDKGRLPPRQ